MSLVDKGERIEEGDLVALLPPSRVLHREVKGKTTGYVKGLPLNAGETLVLDVLSSFGGKLRNKHRGITAIRFIYDRVESVESMSS